MHKGMHKGGYLARAMEGSNACKPMLLAGSGERIRTSDLRVMRPMHGFVVVYYLLLSSVMECVIPTVPTQSPLLPVATDFDLL